MFTLDVSKLPLRKLRKSELLFCQGDEAQHIFLILEGSVRLERQTSEGRRVTLFRAKKGDYFAEASLFSNTYHCDAVAQVESSVRSYPKKLVLEEIKANPQTAEGIAAHLARQLHFARYRAELLTIKNAQERVLVYLQTAADADRRISFRAGDFQDMAAEAGLTRETFYRTLSALEQDGVIERSGNLITLK